MSTLKTSGPPVQRRPLASLGLGAVIATVLLGGVTGAEIARASDPPMPAAAADPVALAAASDPVALAAASDPVALAAASGSHPVRSSSPDRMEQFTAEDFTDDARALPSALTSALARDLGVSGAEYLAQAAAAVDAVHVVDALDAQGVDVLGSRVDGTELLVAINSEADRAAVERAGARVDDAPVVPVDITSTTFTPAFDVNGGEGYAWSNTDGTSRQCSVGVNGVRISDGRPMALTAGHCVAGMTSITGGVRQLVQTVAGNGGSFGQVIGSPGAGSFGGGFDGGLITLDGAGVTARPSVLTWGGGAPRGSAPISVTGQSAAIIGANLCKSGSRTGWTCGTVKSVDRTVNVGGNEVNSILASTCIQPGDSGGAALIGQSIVGVNSSTSSVACGDASYISAFFPMLSTAGKASVQSQFGSVWEPALVVPTPTLSSIAVSPAGVAGAVTGSVASASPRGTVELRIDGASAPVMTVPASNGTWTADLSQLAASVPAGSHRVSASATNGRWSRSIGVETTILIGGSPSQVVGALLPADFVVR